MFCNMLKVQLFLPTPANFRKKNSRNFAEAQGIFEKLKEIDEKLSFATWSLFLLPKKSKNKAWKCKIWISKYLSFQRKNIFEPARL